MDKSQQPQTREPRQALVPGPEIPDPSPYDGQVGEGATLPSAEPLAAAVDKVVHPGKDEKKPAR
jgi:hypothetical protein